MNNRALEYPLVPFIRFIFLSVILSTPCFALEQIIRPYQSVRLAGMGGTLLTTGLYEENFYGNPARNSENPIWKFILLDVSAETNTSLIKNFPTLKNAKGSTSEIVQSVGSTIGTNNHARIQMNSLGFFLPNVGGGKMSYALGLISLNTQADLAIRRNYSVDPDVIAEIGPTLSIARRFLENNILTVGINVYARYRVSSANNIAVTDLLKGKSLGPTQSGGEGAAVDFDIGKTLILPWKPRNIELSTSLSLNNALGGRYSNLKQHPLKLENLPTPQKRRLGFGIGGKRDHLWKFGTSYAGFEFQDIFNNGNGSIFRLIHFGGETQYGVLRFRGGVNQGYFCAGLGLDLKFLVLDVSTYGEEMSLNAGGYQDRRYAARVTLQI